MLEESSIKFPKYLDELESRVSAPIERRARIPNVRIESFDLL